MGGLVWACLLFELQEERKVMMMMSIMELMMMIMEWQKKRKASTQKEKTSKQKKRKRIDYWDVPLPPPGEDNDGDSTNDLDSCNDSDISEDDSDDDAPLSSPLRRGNSSASASSFVNTESTNYLLQQQQHTGGFAPVDLHANERTRNYYVAAPTVMDARSFIFPICHDAVLYQRIKEVQASRRSIGRDLVDGALMEVMKEEGGNIGRWGMVDMWDAVLGGGASNEEGNEDAGADKKKSNDGSNKIDKDKSKGGDKKKEAKQNPEKKSDNSDGTNLVGAGLLETDVDPSWPGLNALSRGRLW